MRDRGIVLYYELQEVKKEMEEVSSKIDTHRKYGVYVLGMHPDEVEASCMRLAELYHAFLEPMLRELQSEYDELIQKKLNERKAAIDRGWIERKKVTEFRNTPFPVLDHKQGVQITLEL